VTQDGPAVRSAQPMNIRPPKRGETGRQDRQHAGVPFQYVTLLENGPESECPAGTLTLWPATGPPPCPDFQRSLLTEFIKGSGDPDAFSSTGTIPVIAATTHFVLG
jgi:hypothetical protein